MANHLVPMPEPERREGVQNVLDRLALLAVPVLLGALGVVLWSLLNSVVDGVHENQEAIAAMQSSIGEIASALEERTGDRWTATQDAQQQVMQALVDSAQNEELIEAKEEVRAHRDRLEALALDLAVGLRRIETLEMTVGTLLRE